MLLVTAKNGGITHPSQPFNPDIANAFFRAGLIEAWGRGIERMLGACESAETPAPEFEVESTGLGVTFHFGETFTQETTQETTQEKILALLREEPSLTRKELAQRIGLSEDGIKYQLDKLKSAKVIRRVGSTKAGHWEVLK